ncbi:MAG TPA: N(G),N(G)-dimethylarginine dimethylaminohydrolase [Candidatus Eisenbacteria bacterium]|nr:N(G),N(G)-dimethylarginine dimethylaminohydrolase [Candidatus Eisenbacteria bacterium]
MFRRAIVRPPSANFAHGLTTADLGVPDHRLALAQHAAYAEALERCGLDVIRLPDDPRHPDATFVEDTAVLTPRAAILTRPGAPSRAGEVEGVRAALAPWYPEPLEIMAPGTLDGGDVCETERGFLVGISDRTNEEGAAQLARHLAVHGAPSTFLDVRGVQGILHLKSGVSSLGDGRVAAIDAFAGHPALRGYEVVPVASEESYAANCVRVNGRVLVAAGFPRFERALRALGVEMLALDVSEFAKMDGGLSCLSLRF